MRRETRRPATTRPEARRPEARRAEARRAEATQRETRQRETRRLGARRRTVAFRVASWLAAVCVVMAAVPARSQAPASKAPQLPAAVTKAFQQAYPTATISSTKQEGDKDRTLFRVESTDKGRRRSVLYDSNGKVIEVGDQVDEKELPRPVFDAIHAHRRAIFVSAMKVTRGSNVEYRITVRGSRRTAMVAKPDGTVVSFE